MSYSGPRLPSQRSPFSAALRKWRRGEELTQLTLARRLHISCTLMASYELGTRRPTQDVLDSLERFGFVYRDIKPAKAKPACVLRRMRREETPEEIPEKILEEIPYEERPIGTW